MSVDILVTGSLVYTGDRVIRNGYVYVKNGRVVAVGEEPVPEEYTYATLLLGGPGRIVAPGLAAYADVAAYVLRGYRPRLLHRARFYSAMSVDSLARIALPAIYELHLSGVTTLVVEGPKGLDATLAATLGGFYEAAVPSCTGRGEVTVWGEGCGSEGVLRVNGANVYYGDEPVLALVTRLSYSLAGIRDAYRLSLRLRKALGLPGGSIAEGERAEIVVFNATEPPSLLLDLYEGIDYGDAIYYIGARAESVVVGDDVLVDGGEHLRIVRKHFNEVRNLAARILGETSGEPGR